MGHHFNVIISSAPTSSPPISTSLDISRACDVRNGDDQAQGGRQAVGSEEQGQNADGHSFKGGGAG